MSNKPVKMLSSGGWGEVGEQREKRATAAAEREGEGGVTGGALSPQRHLLCQKCTSIISALCAERKQRKGTERRGRERGEEQERERSIQEGRECGGG